MAHSNSHKDKRFIQHDAHNRKPGRAKFWKDLGHRKGRRWRNRISREWVESRELDQSSRATRDNRSNPRERTESEMPFTL